MDVFDLDHTLVADYASFARSLTEIRAPDIRGHVDQIYARRRFWPEPLITVHPHFEQLRRQLPTTLAEAAKRLRRRPIATSSVVGLQVILVIMSRPVSGSGR